MENSRMWEVENKGFLPSSDPVSITKKESKGTWSSVETFFAALDRFMENVPELLEERKFREEVVSFLRSNRPNEEFHYEWGTECLERLFKHYCYMASSYIHALHENTACRLPIEIAKPLFLLSTLLDRKPILSYSCYALNNWRRIDPTKPLVIENLALLQNFSNSNKRDEDWFILIHVDIEARAALGISAIKQYKDLFYKNESPGNLENCDPELYSDFLEKMRASLFMMNITMARMPERCSEDFYFKAVRPFIFSFENVRYEGVRSEPFTLRGETGAQSSIVPAFVAALGIEHKDSMLTKHLKDMRDYMPKEHRVFIKELELINSAGMIGTFREVAKSNLKCQKLYNACLEELLRFRTKHLEFAINYIQKKVDNPTGTGGTPFIPWLTQLKDETEKMFLYNGVLN